MVRIVHIYLGQTATPAREQISAQQPTWSPLGVRAPFGPITKPDTPIDSANPKDEFGDTQVTDYYHGELVIPANW